jgi:hypothetical protein
MMDWTVNIEAGGDLAAEQVDLDLLDVLAEMLADHHAAATAGPRRYGAQFDVEAPTAEKASEVALSAFCEAAEKARLPDWPIRHIELMRVEDQQAALSEPTFPDVVGVTEAAHLLGVSRQRLDQLTSRDDFPAPMVRLAAGPVWLRSSIKGFERRWDRRPGRPAKAAQPSKPDDSAVVIGFATVRTPTTRKYAASAKRAAGGSFKMPAAKTGKAAKVTRSNKANTAINKRTGKKGTRRD